MRVWTNTPQKTVILRCIASNEQITSSLLAVRLFEGLREPGWANFAGAVDGFTKADDGGVQALPTSNGLARKCVGCGELFRDNAPQLFERGGEVRSDVGQRNGTSWTRAMCSMFCVKPDRVDAEESAGCLCRTLARIS